jgi:hypothetical protein
MTVESVMPSLDLEFVREQFPALSRHWPDWIDGARHRTWSA